MPELVLYAVLWGKARRRHLGRLLACGGPSKEMVSYPGNFLRLLQEQCDAKSLLKRIQNLDKDATEKRSEYAKLEEDIIAKASALILNQDATADEIRELLDSDSLKQLEERRNEMSEIRSQTVREALAGYDMLDNQITILDQDLTALEPQLKFGQVLPGGGGRRKYSRQSAGDAGGAFAAAAQEGGAAAAAALVQEDMDVDPNEPVYCTCKKVSFGQMIACENDECEIEWFHFECVGLTEQPADKWYCPACSAAKTD